MAHVTIDSRWINTSGIGTYLTNVLPGVIRQNTDVEFLLLGDTSKLLKLCGSFPNAEFKNFSEPMYSISEQLKYPQIIPTSTDLYFATHFNVPI